MIVLRISRASFNEIAACICSSPEWKRAHTKKPVRDGVRGGLVEDGQIVRVDLPGLRIELIK